MTREQHLPDEARRAIAAEQDAFLARAPLAPDAVAEAAMHRAWKPARPRRLVPYLAVASLAACVAFMVAWVVSRSGHGDLRFEVAGRAGQTGATITARDGTPLPLRFSDGSVLTFAPGAKARVAELHDTGAELLLDSGRMLVDVRHTDQARWSVAAGPFQVRITGTRFTVDWSPASGKLALEMHEGSVIVLGPTLAQGLSLRGGESLDVGLDSPAVVTRRLAVAAPAPLAAAEPSAPPERSPAAVPSAAPAGPTESPAAVPTRHPVGWSELAAGGRHAEALAAAEREGFPRLLRHLDAPGLLALGDTARYAAAPARARQAFEALVRRFSRDQRSQDARFALGRLEFEAGVPARAARWFERYLDTPGNPPLAEEAAGRLFESYERAGDREAATRAAKRYLLRYPQGLRASLARKVLSASSPEAPQ
jgi:ferric-dicitrate binding protein FerR (iron transport regulator)